MKIQISTSGVAAPLTNLQKSAIKHVQVELTYFTKNQPKMSAEDTAKVMGLVYDLEKALDKVNSEV